MCAQASACVFAKTYILGVNWVGSTKLGPGLGPSPLRSGSRRSLEVDVIGLIKQLYVPLWLVFSLISHG